MPALSGTEARERFAASPIARLATADAAGRPHLVPVVFAVVLAGGGAEGFAGGGAAAFAGEGADRFAGGGAADFAGDGADRFARAADRVVMAVDHKPKRSPRLKRLANIRANPAVSLLVDVYDEDWDRLWWARADGHARVLPPAARSAAAARCTDLLVAKYPRQYADLPPSGEVVEVLVTAWTGWRAT